jgi:parallel beta-helix repeat protein
VPLCWLWFVVGLAVVVRQCDSIYFGVYEKFVDSLVWMQLIFVIQMCASRRYSLRQLIPHHSPSLPSCTRVRIARPLTQHHSPFFSRVHVCERHSHSHNITHRPFHRVHVFEWHSHANANAFECTFSNGNVFRRNRASYCSYGFWLGFSYNTTVEGNVMLGNGNGVEIDHGQHNTIAGQSAATHYHYNH